MVLAAQSSGLTVITHGTLAQGGHALPLPDDIAAYVQRVMALPGVAAWVKEACAEQDFLDFEEPYRLQR